MSFFAHAKIETDLFCVGMDFYISLSWAHFKQLNAYLFHGALNLVVEPLKDAKLDKSHINETVTVSGPTCMPTFQKLLKIFLNGGELNKTIIPHEEVALLFAHWNDREVMAGLIKRDTTVLTKQTCVVHYYDNQTTA